MIIDDFSSVKFHKYKFPIIVVYENPNGYPGKHVARIWDTEEILEFILIRDTLKEIEEFVPPWFTKIMPSAEDDPKIVATYI